MQFVQRQRLKLPGAANRWYCTRTSTHRWLGRSAGCCPNYANWTCSRSGPTVPACRERTCWPACAAAGRTCSSACARTSTWTACPSTASHAGLPRRAGAGEASLTSDHRAGILKVRLLHQSRNGLNEALEPLQAELKPDQDGLPGHQPAPLSRSPSVADAEDKAHRPRGRTASERQVGDAAHSAEARTPPAQPPRTQCPNSSPQPLPHGLSSPPAARIWTSIVSPCPEL